MSINKNKTMSTEQKIINKLRESFLAQNIECDGPGCMGCWKDVVREAINMLEEINKQK